MEKIDFLYGKTKIAANIPDGVDYQVVRAKKTEPAEEAEKIVKKALLSPVGSPTLKELSKDAKKIVIITNDNTRPLPSSITLPVILGELYYPEEYYDITILIAAGLHRRMSEDEIAEKFGAEFCKTHKIVCHNAKDPEQNVLIGSLSDGGELYIDKIAAECDLLIAEGFIEPHFFAGFSGGRKSILPGIAGEKTIMNNHSPANIASSYARQGVLENNPIHMQCVEAAKMAKLRFILNVALNEDKKIVAAFAGDPEKAHETGCEYVRRMMSVPVRRTDIVVVSNNGYPLDRNLYQAVKGIDTAAKVVKDKGVIIMAAQCLDGVGHGSFSDLIQSCKTLESLISEMKAPEFASDKWQVQVLARALEKATVILVNDTIDEETLKSMFIEYAPDINTAIEKARKKAGDEASISFIPEGPVIMPVLE